MFVNGLKTVSLAGVVLLNTVMVEVAFTPVAAALPASSSTEIIAQNNILASGLFMTVEQDHPTEGTARIINENGKRYLEFDGAFTTAQGPDVNVILHRNSSIPVNLKEGEYITLASLQSFDGSQRYLLPDDLDISQYKSVGIWCREFNVTFGYASL
ncbi:DM13 domain-containing protein [Capilliphycus salinus ALCB114379]|uniref:DM13 domain-containing protein n=1 Tax=Capilliphycus salinus TaxID=2768948 RepID=UPI0039A71C38